VFGNLIIEEIEGLLFVVKKKGKVEFVNENV
jgi:hypothetical protein